MINNIYDNFKTDQPELSVPYLVKLFQAIKNLPQGNWRSKKLEEVQQIIESCSGLYIEATSSHQKVVQGDSLPISLFLINRTEVKAFLKNVVMENFDSSFSIPLQADQSFSLNKTVPVSWKKPISQPYWLEYPLVGGTFDVRDQTLIGKAENDPSFQAAFLVNIAGQDFTIKRPVQYRVIDPVKGDTYEPIAVLPRIELNYDKENYLSVNGQPAMSVIHLKSNRAALMDSYKVEQVLSSHWIMSNKETKSQVSPLFERDIVSTYSPKSKLLNLTESISVIATKGNEVYDGYTKTIAYDHIPTITFFPKAKANLVGLNVKTVGKKIGYIVGAGDKVPQALEAMGYEVKIISEPDITANNLNQFDAIIIGIRAYNIYEYLTNKNDVLMQYVENGGNLIVQYLKSNQVGAKKVKVGPYPFFINALSRVTEEDARVNFLIPDHPVLNYPNKITEEDFEGWVQERSTYQAMQLDNHYQAPLGMNDKGDQQSNGSLAIAKYGKGNFVYASLVFFRQLPAGIPGAYRLMANLIGLPKN